ncbi:nucleotide exchange factor GrpE [Nocardioides coralli]|uniref:nucleotide exchange factor GrpE n=1 Tax=Nocardioides coralli TaxID=2872154 RepID=UPI0020174B06|nr:nucleotide exchange factor GrpE [Nocardioides coralli]
MTDAPLTPEGEPEPEAAADADPPQPSADEVAGGEPAASGFGDAAAEMANETEVEPGDESATEHDELTAARVALQERTVDLQRLQADYLNYKRRVERDRELIEQNATYRVLSPIIEVLDTIDRAREHGDLDEGFTAVADQLERVVSKLGLTKFGEPGEPFDPNLHEALSHIGEDPDVEVTTCKVVAKAGYRIGERVVRAAQVLVVDPAAG